jgi:hypothetical protein
MTLAAMKANVTQRMSEEKIPANIIKVTVAKLAHLKRWKVELIAGKQTEKNSVTPGPPGEKHSFTV